MVAKTQSRIVPCAECGTLIKRNVPLAYVRNFFCNFGCKGNYQKRAKLLTRDQLFDLYVTQKMSSVDIGLIVNRDQKSVWNWLKDYGIQTRPRGSDERQQFGKGKPHATGWHHSDATKEKLRQARVDDGSKGLFLPNGDHVLKGRRGENHPSWKGGSSPVRQAFYASDEWKSACVSVWQRDDAKCQKCGLDHRSIDRDTKKFHVHHIFGFTRYPLLRADPNNLALLCDTCHRWVHSKKNVHKEWIGHEKT